MPSLSIIIPTLNEEKLIERTRLATSGCGLKYVNGRTILQSHIPVCKIPPDALQ